jgi:transcription elongation factor Elf1
MKLFRCPCCNKLHFTRLNGIQFENNFKTLKDYIIKRKIECSKCYINISILVHKENGSSKIIWDDYYKFEDETKNQMQKLQEYKDEILKNDENDDMKRHRLESVLKEIRSIQNFVSKNQTSLRIKARITAPGASSGITDRLSGHTRIE